MRAAALSCLQRHATSPGNTAGDGSGAHGLYTENLLREIKVPEAKIEDVLKRVRLNVRRKSEGQQIPWESTSLEDDFYFLPPQHVKKLSEAEIEKQFNAELAVWEKIKNAQEPGAIEEYLRKNPSGRFSELAQYQLDRILARLGEKKIQLVVEKDNPFTKGSARIDTQFKVGDSYTYRQIDLFTKIELKTAIYYRITQVTEDQVIFGRGGRSPDHFGNQLKVPDGRGYSRVRSFSFLSTAFGKKGQLCYKISHPDGSTSENEIEFKVVAREQITVPAGSFDAFKVEGEGWSRNSGSKWQLERKTQDLIAPGIRWPVAKRELRAAHTSGKVLNNERVELTGDMTAIERRDTRRGMKRKNGKGTASAPR